MNSLPWMKLYVGKLATKTRTMTIEEKGVVLELIMLMWEDGRARVEVVEDAIGRPLTNLRPVVRDLIAVDAEGYAEMPFVSSEHTYAHVKKKQAARAANLRWERERMRSHSDAHSDRNAVINADAMPLEKRREEKREKRESARATSITSLPFDAFREACLAVHREHKILPDTEAKAFFDYWTEGHPVQKPRYARQQVFDIAKRMRTWRRNNDGRPNAAPAEEQSSTLKSYRL